jgi:D-serine deaminase-like pyridoxal phosphate-dependent protein
MDALLQKSTMKLRPHYKSHKCAAIAHEQIRRGAIGMTCAKLSEAEDLIDSGIEDILIANQITDKEKLARLAHLAKKCKLCVCVDDADNIAELEIAAAAADAHIHCLVEFEIGMERCGVKSKEEALRLALLLARCPHLSFDGIQAYAGHVSHDASVRERATATLQNGERIRELIAYFGENGVEVPSVSGGSTGTSIIKAVENLYTELQAGSYLFMDATYHELGLPFAPSLFLLTTVVSARDGLIVVDGGVKSCGVDQGMPLPVGFSVSKIVASEEHFQLHDPSEKFSVGEKICLMPAHCCSTVNLHDRIYLVDQGQVTDRYPVTARGCFR